ncbi:probable very-long-chain enoyl-CoA reductase art-1 [Diabrotica undecimpunctata]|uniref:probable very-long-chain enoyl-CoA reductase art-1 n=1 Tax=Diabrotica undecimpunctata TaxID=50387 RepID=UPI003B633E22
MVQVEVYTVKNKKLGDITASNTTTVGDIKKEIAKVSKFPVDRQSLRSEVKGKDIKNDATIPNLESLRKVFVKDLGPQIGWNTVFLLEYAGPLFIYAAVSFRPWILYGDNASNSTFTTTAKIALGCWSIHYLKRILETLFVHRFSHGTMPIRNLFKNCGYYWGFCLYVAYHINHPLFTPPPLVFQAVGLLLFAVCESGNLATHLLLRNLRPAGSTVRKIPRPDGCPLNILFDFVSCPNYSYEVGSWIGFTILTSCIPAGLFTAAGFYQMTLWALGKHKNYKKEFPDYPKQRKAIIPFIL